MFQLALKNIFFYKSRAITTVVLTFVSTLLFIVYVAMMDGSHNSMLSNSLKIYTGAIEVYKKGYREEGGEEYLLENVTDLEAKIRLISGVVSVTSRYETYGLLSSRDYSTPAMVAGINPTLEASMSQLKEAKIAGEFLSDTSDNCLYAGAELIQKLHITLGQEVSFIGGASDGSFVAELFSLCGIFKTGSFEFDSSSSFMSRNYFDTLMYAQDRASYLTIKVNNLENVEQIRKAIEAVMPSDIEVLSWKTLMKSMVEMMEVDSIFGYISLSLFFVVIFFVIMIFGFINVSSRIREFGTLRCIGVSQKQINLLLLYEIAILSSLAVVLATPLGGFIAYYFSLHPIIIEGISETYKEYGLISDEMPFRFDILTIAWNVGVIYLLNFLSILYPMSYLKSFTPLEATHHV